MESETERLLRVLRLRLTSSGAWDNPSELIELREDIHHCALLPRPNWSERFLEDIEVRSEILSLLNTRIEDLRTRDGDVENLVKEALEIVVQTWKVEAQTLETKIEDDLAARPDCCPLTTGNPPCRICHDSRWKVWSWSVSLVDCYKYIDRIYGTGITPIPR